MKKSHGLILTLVLFIFLGAIPAMANNYELKEIKGKTSYIPLGKGIVNYSDVVTDGTIIEKTLTYPKKKLNIELDTTINNTTSFRITPLKAGKSTVSFKYKVEGKTKKVSFKVVAFKTTNKPFKSIQFGSYRLDNTMANMMPLFNFQLGINSANLLDAGKDTAKLSIKCNSGWKIKSIKYYNPKGKAKKVTNNKKLTVEDGGYIKVVFRNKKKYEAIYTIYGVFMS